MYVLMLKIIYFHVIMRFMRTKRELINILKNNKQKIQKYGAKNIGLFGSYIRDEQKEHSDIDILVDFYPEKENFDNFMAVCDYIENLFSREKVEIVTKNGLSPFIGPKILKEVLFIT